LISSRGIAAREYVALICRRPLLIEQVVAEFAPEKEIAMRTLAIDDMCGWVQQLKMATFLSIHRTDITQRIALHNLAGVTSTSPRLRIGNSNA
jgi:hypothetical protein